VPSPNVAEDHQTKNARALQNNQAAVLITDAEANTKLIVAAIELLKDSTKLESLSKNCAKLAFPNATKTIATEVLKLANLTN
jgi:UDP-N-acetylglucosamine--N-acetylmuramyl-(pentapeptide) pyrophosphoryl-undecaprenol N-acetylglucosamine transferase